MMCWLFSACLFGASSLLLALCCIQEAGTTSFAPRLPADARERLGIYSILFCQVRSQFSWWLCSSGMAMTPVTCPPPPAGALTGLPSVCSKGRGGQQSLPHLWLLDAPVSAPSSYPHFYIKSFQLTQWRGPGASCQAREYS